MATIRIKKRAAGGAAGAPASLASSELAYNEQDNTLYYGFGDTGSAVATSITAIAGSGAYTTLGTTQTVTGNKTFSGSVALNGTSTAVTQANTDNSTNIATTAFVVSKLSAGGYGTVSSVSLSLPGIFTVTGSPVTTTGTLTASLANQAANLVFAGPTTGSATPTFRSLAASDIPNLTVSKLTDFTTSVAAFRLDQFAAPTADVSHNNTKIINLADPVNAQDAATKNYVDSNLQGLKPKQSVKAASTANIATLSGTMTVDGIALVAGDRILVKDQTTASQNGIYAVAAGSWTRTSDADTWSELVSAFVFVEQGTTNADNGFVCTVDQGGTINTTAVNWVQFSGAGQITVNSPLSKTGNTISLSGTVAVANGGTGATTLTGYVYGNGTGAFTASATIPGTAISGNISGSAANVTGTVAIANGGTGATTASAARTALAAAASGANADITSLSGLTTALTVAQGGTGATTLTGLVKGNGTGAMTAATAGTDYLAPSSTIDGGTF